jgi:dihydroorotase
MKILIQSPTLLDKKSPFHLREKNVLVQNGKITDIGDKNFSADRVIPAKGMYLSPGWFDLGCVSGDPGLESKEDLSSLTKTATQAGFTDLALLPNTQPMVQTKTDVQYLTQANENRLVQLHALAAITKNAKGEEMTDMHDLHMAGAIGFTDGLKHLGNTDIFLKALQYVQRFQGLVLDHPEDHWLSLFGQMHEGVTSTQLGLKGIPRLAEELALMRNLELLAYAGGRLHLSRLSTARALELVKSAKRKGLNVTCDCTTYQATLDDSVLVDFDTNYKVSPPLREKSDQEAIVKALKDGTLDVLVSGHVPQDDESKAVEFDHAEPGIVNLATVASQLVTLAQDVPMEELIHKISVAPREIAGLEVPTIQEDTRACLTLLDPARKWLYSEANHFSKSKNSPWLGKSLTGKVVAVFNNNKQWLDVV